MPELTAELPTSTGAAAAPAVSVSRVLMAFRTVTPLLSALPDALREFDGLSDSELLALQHELTTQRRSLESRAILVAAQIARRSAPELGSSGLAQRGGYRTPEELIRVTTGSTVSDARSAVRVARTVDEAQRGGRIDQVTGEFHEPERPWLLQSSRAVARGELSIAAAEAIRNGLGDPTSAVTAAMLSDAAASLLREARVFDADRLYRRARELRDELDLEGVALREEERRAARSLRLTRHSDGGARLVWDMDAETLAIVGECYDQLTSPRRGGPRFVDPESPEQQRAERILNDERTIEQLASDGFLELLRVAADTAPAQLVGLRRPSVRVLVPASALARRAGRGVIEGQSNSVSIDTVERIACSEGRLDITIDSDGQPLDVGREQRLYTRRQRIALAARDGGCRWPGCERPPAWTEAHHIRHWARDGGSTDVADGILLCRHHHLLSHNNHWEITRTGADYSLIPPPDVDPSQKPIPMSSRSTAMRDALRRPVTLDAGE